MVASLHAPEFIFHENVGMDAILERRVYYFPSLFFQKEGPILPRFIEIYTVLVVVIAVYFK